MDDIRGTEIKIGDLLLNLRDPRIDPWDSWAILMCVPGYESIGDPVIRDFNAWNLGWKPSETLVIGPFDQNPWILANVLHRTIDDIKAALNNCYARQRTVNRL